MAVAGRRIRRAILQRNFRRPRVFLDRSNPLEAMDGDMLFRRYRFHRETMTEIIRLCGDAARTTGRSFAIPVVLAVCAYLRYLATGDMQLTVGDTINLSQSTVSRCCRQVADILVQMAGEFIQFPVGQQAIEVKQGLGGLAGFPNVIGCIDCTHVWIKKPSDHPEDYIGRKGIPTINVQAVCDHRFMIRSLVVKWPGRTHDARIWRLSNLKEQFENGEHDGFLLGDSGYPLSVYLMTPYAIVRTPAQQKFNGALCRTRVLVEQTFGILKQRFQILRRKMMAHPARATTHIQNCVILHNLGILRNDIIPPCVIEEDDALNDINGAEALEGKLMRDNIATRYFQ